MAIADITELVPDLKAIEVLASATATNSAPSGASAGLDMNVVSGAFGKIPSTMTARIASTAGSATMTVTIRIWGYQGTLGWAPLGYLNGGSAIAETSADSIQYAEPLELPGHFSRIYFEITAIGGTDTAVTGYLVARRQYGGV